MSNVTFPNVSTATNDARKGIWALSRGMKGAGCITLASSDGTTKDTTGTYSNKPWIFLRKYLDCHL